MDSFTLAMLASVCGCCFAAGLTLRCCWCLSGVGDAVGLFGVSPGKMLLPAAKAYLERRNLPPRHPDAKPWRALEPRAMVRRLSNATSRAK